MPKQILLRTSERVTFRSCRQKWKWSYVDGLEPKATSGALAFGNMVHQALEAWYMPGKERGEHPAIAFQKIFDAQPFNGRQWDEDGNAIESRELGVAMLNSYIEEYGEDKHIEVIEPEHKIAIDVYNSQGVYLVTLVLTLDGLIIDHKSKRIKVLEHKTARSITNVYINSQYGDQALTYNWAANISLRDRGILKKKESVDGVVFNFLRKALPDTRFKNENGHCLNNPSKTALLDAALKIEPDNAMVKKFTIDQLTTWLHVQGIETRALGEVSKTQPPAFFSRQDLFFGEFAFANLEKRLRNESWEMQRVRKGKLPIYKNPSGDCSFCPFKEPCELHEMGADFQTVLDYNYTTRDPYTVYELRKEH